VVDSISGIAGGFRSGVRLRLKNVVEVIESKFERRHFNTITYRNLQVDHNVIIV